MCEEPVSRSPVADIDSRSLPWRTSHLRVTDVACLPVPQPPRLRWFSALLSLTWQSATQGISPGSGSLQEQKPHAGDQVQAHGHKAFTGDWLRVSRASQVTGCACLGDHRWLAACVSGRTLVYWEHLLLIPQDQLGQRFVGPVSASHSRNFCYKQRPSTMCTGRQGH